MISFYYYLSLSKMQNTFDDSLNILKYHIIMISKNSNPLLVEIVCPYQITFISHRLMVYFTIQLYAQFDFRAIEIKDV